jgi:hypothetical protein
MAKIASRNIIHDGGTITFERGIGILLDGVPIDKLDPNKGKDVPKTIGVFLQILSDEEEKFKSGIEKLMTQEDPEFWTKIFNQIKNK